MFAKTAWGNNNPFHIVLRREGPSLLVLLQEGHDVMMSATDWHTHGYTALVPAPVRRAAGRAKPTWTAVRLIV